MSAPSLDCPVCHFEYYITYLPTHMAAHHPDHPTVHPALIPCAYCDDPIPRSLTAYGVHLSYVHGVETVFDPGHLIQEEP